MASKWFLEVFLPSLIEKMEGNEKYPNSMILSERQAEVCRRNMEHKESHTDYGWMGYQEIAVDGYMIKMIKRGKYTILNLLPVATKKQENDAKKIREEIESKECDLDILYEDKEKNQNQIQELEDEINRLWELYNETLKIKK